MAWPPESEVVDKGPGRAEAALVVTDGRPAEEGGRGISLSRWRGWPPSVTYPAVASAAAERYLAQPLARVAAERHLAQPLAGYDAVAVLQPPSGI